MDTETHSGERVAKSDGNNTADGRSTLAKKAPELEKALEKANKGTRHRPKRLTEKHIETLWCEIAKGRSMSDVCNDAKMPSRATVLRHLSKNPELRQMIDEAYEYQAEFFAEFMVDVASGGVHSTGNVERDKLYVQTLKWVTERYNRKRFGQHVDIAVKSEGPAINLPSEFGGGVLQGQIISPTNPAQDQDEE